MNNIETKHKEEPRYNEPVYNVVLGITKNLFTPSNSKIYGKKTSL